MRRVDLNLFTVETKTRVVGTGLFGQYWLAIL